MVNHLLKILTFPIKNKVLFVNPQQNGRKIGEIQGKFGLHLDQSQLNKIGLDCNPNQNFRLKIQFGFVKDWTRF